MDLALRDMGLDPTLVSALHDLIDFSDESDKSHHAPSRAFIREAKAMAATPADVKEYPNAYVFIIDMPGLKPDQVKVQIDDGNVVVVSGERRREKDPEGGKFLKMERRLGKYLKKFVLPKNANPEAVTAVNQDGVLTVTVEKRPPPEEKKPKTIEVQVASAASAA